MPSLVGELGGEGTCSGYSASPGPRHEVLGSESGPGGESPARWRHLSSPGGNSEGR